MNWEAADDAREIDARTAGLRRRAETELSDIDWAEVERSTSDGPESDSLAPADSNAPPATLPPLFDPAALTAAAQEEANGLGLADPPHEADLVRVAQNGDGVENDADPESSAEIDPEGDEPADDLTGARGRKARRDARYPKRAAAQAYADAVTGLQQIEADLTRIQNRTGAKWDQIRADLEAQKAALEAQRDANFPENAEERDRVNSALRAEGLMETGINTIGVTGIGKLGKPFTRTGAGRATTPASADRTQDTPKPKSTKHKTKPPIAPYPGGGKPPDWTSTKDLSSDQNRAKHWRDHREEFPNLKNEQEYFTAAREFANNPPEGTEFKVSIHNGDIMMYHPPSNTHVVTDKYGVLRTMHKFDPKKHRKASNREYWNEK